MKKLFTTVVLILLFALPLGSSQKSLQTVKVNNKPADPTIQKTVMENMFYRLLEGLHKDEAKLLISVKDKELHNVYKGLSTQVVSEAFGWNEDFQEYK